MGNVIFDGVSSLDLGIQVEHPPAYVIPEREYETVSIPGRNGDIFIDKGSYKNYDQPYEIAIGDLNRDFTELAERISMWLHPKPGYCRLEDSYSPDYYRLAMFNSEVDIENILFHAGRVTVNFNCKPQRYLKRGERSVIFSGSGTKTLKNPTLQTASPIITLTLSSSSTSTASNFQIGSYTGSVKGVTSIVIDSELQDCYDISGITNLNDKVTLGSGGFPKLVPGNNEISFSGYITKMEVIPKWWTL